MSSIIIYGHIATIILSFATFFYKYKINSYNIFFNYFFYLLFGSLFYISLPSLFSLITNFSYITSESETIVNTAGAGLVFVIFFLIIYSLSYTPRFNINKFRMINDQYLNTILLTVSILIFIYVASLIFNNLVYIYSIYGDRSTQSTFSTYLQNTYKVKSLFIFQIMVVSYLLFNKRHRGYLIFFIPFIIYDLLLSGREYLFGVLISSFILMIAINKPIKVKLLIVLLFLVLSSLLLRVQNFEFFSLGTIFQIIGEFNYTWQNTHLIYESNQSHDFSESLKYGLLRIFPSPVYFFLFGKYTSFAYIAGSNNPLGWGLAGSIVAEALAFKSIFATIFFLFIIFAYGVLINFLLRTYYFSGFAIFIIAVLYVQQILRYSFFELALYPFYVLIFLGFVFLALDIFNSKNLRKKIK